MGVNKIIYDGETLMDITDSTVTEETLVEGAVAYNAAGERIVGAAAMQVDSVPTAGSGNAVSSGGVFAALGAADHVAADKVKFTDGETFQQKLESGALQGAKGDTGPAGESTVASRHSVTLSASGWSAGSGYAYAQTVSLSGVTAETDFDVDAEQSGTDAEADALILEAFSLVTFADSVSGGIRFACPTEMPEISIPLSIRIYA